MATVPPREAAPSALATLSHKTLNAPFCVESVSYDSGTDTLTTSVGNGRTRLASGALFELDDVVDELTDYDTVGVSASSTYYVFISNGTTDVAVSLTGPGSADIPLATFVTDAAKDPAAPVDVRSMLPSAPANGVLIGEVRQYAGAGLPYGWLSCDGAAVSRTDYHELFAAIGTAWGVGDGATTFNLPNMAGRTVVGVGILGDDTYAIGDDGGEARHAMTAAEMPTHSHTGPNHSHAGTSHNHTGPSHSHTADPPNTNSGYDSHSHTATTSEDSHTHNIYKRQVGTTTEHNHSTAQSGGVAAAPSAEQASGNTTNSVGVGNDIHAHSLTTNNPSHRHTLNIPSFNTGNSGTGVTSTNGEGDTGNGGTGATSTTGSGSEQENRQPFAALRFIIRA
jgi:microcystin-dependent protein